MLIVILKHVIYPTKVVEPKQSGHQHHLATILIYFWHSSLLHQMSPNTWDVYILDVIFPIYAPHIESEIPLFFFRHAFHQVLSIAIIKPALSFWDT